MNGSVIGWVVQGVVIAGAAIALLYALSMLHKMARLALQAAELQAQSIQSARAVVEAATRVQRLAVRPVLKVGIAVQGLSDVGRTPVVFALRLHNVGHGTAVIEEVQLWVRGELALAYGVGATDLPARVDSAVFQRAVGASVQSLSGRLTVTPLTDEARALEAAGSLDLLRVQVFAHNAETVEQGLTTLSAVVGYRDLDGGRYTSTEQFRSLST